MDNTQKAQFLNLLLEDSKGDDCQQTLQDMEDCLGMVFSESEISDDYDTESDETTEENTFVNNYIDDTNEPKHTEPKQNDDCSFVAVIEAYSDEDFKLQMKLERSTVEYIISNFSQFKVQQRPTHGGRSKMGCRKEVYIYVWYATNATTFAQLGTLFGITKSSAWNAVRRVSCYFITVGDNYVQWPDFDPAEETHTPFELRKKIPYAIGAIDCTHIHIKAPRLNKKQYKNTKQKYSIVMQAVVDHDKKFIDITCGEPGSFSEGVVLRKSNLYANALNNFKDWFPHSSFLLCSSAYPVTSWLVPPFKDNDYITDGQRKFNSIHFAAKKVTDDTFRLLRGRFKCLNNFTEQVDLSAVTQLVVSACVLYNICLIKGDLYSETILVQESEDESVEYEFATGSKRDEDVFLDAGTKVDRRQALFSYLQKIKAI